MRKGVFFRPPTWKPILATALGLSLLGFCAVYFRNEFLILRTYPPQGSQVGVTAWVGVEFLSSPAPERVQKRLQIEPAVEGEMFWDDTKMWFRPGMPLIPGQTYTARLEPGWEGGGWEGIGPTLTWQFEVRPLELIFLSQPAGRIELVRMLLPYDQKRAKQVTHGTGEILDYTFSREGSELLLAIANDRGGSDLWILNRDGSGEKQIVACGEHRCTEPAWSPAGHRVAYSRAAPRKGGGGFFDPARLWTVDTRTGQTSELLGDDHRLVGGPSWSPDGRRLSFYDASLDGIRILDLETGEEGVLPSGFGIQGAWSPDGTAFLFPGLAIESGRGRVTLHLADLISRETMEVIDQSYEWQDVGSPQWSPGGEWIAIGVQPGMAGPGRQIWLLKPDGSGAHPIVEDPGFTFGGYRWDPWGERLVFQRFALDRPDDQPEVWIWTIATKELARISESAWLPDWLP